MTAPDGKTALNRRQCALIDRLCRPPYLSMAAAAREIGVPVDTANRWSATSEFRDALETQRSEEAASIRSELLAQILAQGGAAITCKVSLLDAKSETVRHSASSWLLDRILGKNGPSEVEAEEPDAAGEMWAQLSRALDTPVRVEIPDSIPDPFYPREMAGEDRHSA